MNMDERIQKNSSLIEYGGNCEILWGLNKRQMAQKKLNNVPQNKQIKFSFSLNNLVKKFIVQHQVY